MNESEKNKNGFIRGGGVSQISNKKNNTEWGHRNLRQDAEDSVSCSIAGVRNFSHYHTATGQTPEAHRSQWPISFLHSFESLKLFYSYGFHSLLFGDQSASLKRKCKDWKPVICVDRWHGTGCAKGRPPAGSL